MEEECSFTRGRSWFRYRAAAIIVEDGCVLLAGNKSENYLYSVGGGVYVGEHAEEAVVREVFEETGIRFEVDRLAVIHENFWEGNGAYDKGLHCHEIALYFLMKPRGTRELDSDSVTRFGDRETMHWVPIDQLGEIKAFPTFLKEYFASGHEGIMHIVTDERCGG